MGDRLLPTTILTGVTNVGYPYYGEGTNVARLSDGTMIGVFIEPTTDDVLFYYSTNDGDSWTKCTTEDTTATVLNASPAAYLYSYIWIAADDTIHYTVSRATISGTEGYAWGFASFGGTDVTVTQGLAIVSTDSTAAFGDFIVIEDPDSSSNWRLLGMPRLSSSKTYLVEATAPKAGGSVTGVASTQIFTNNAERGRVVMTDNGDARTPASATADHMLIVRDAATAYRKFCKITWNSGTSQYDMGTWYNITTSNYYYHVGSGYDAVNSKYWAIFTSNATGTTIYSYYWAAADTAGTAGDTAAFSNTTPNMFTAHWLPEGRVVIVRTVSSSGNNCANQMDVSGGWGTATWDDFNRPIHLGSTYYDTSTAMGVKQNYNATNGYVDLVLHKPGASAAYSLRAGGNWGNYWDWPCNEVQGDDGYWYPSVIQIANSYNYLGNYLGQSMDTFWRFPSVNAEGTIEKLEWRYLVHTAATATGVNLDLYFEDSDDATAPTTAAAADALTLTTATVAKTPDSAYSSTWNISWGGLKTLAQEIVDRAGWTPGNAMMLVGKDNASTSNNYVAAYGWDATYPSYIIIQWTPGARITDPALSDGDTLTVDAFLRIVADTVLSDSDTLTVDDFLHILADTVLSDTDTLNVDVFNLITHITDTVLSDGDSLTVDAFLKILKDLSLVDTDVLWSDTLYIPAYGAMSPFWIWRYVRGNGTLQLVPLKGGKAWRADDIVSSDIRYNTGYAAEATQAVQAAWAANKDADTATLRAAIDAALAAAGFVKADGSHL